MKRFLIAICVLMTLVAGCLAAGAEGNDENMLADLQQLYGQVCAEHNVAERELSCTIEEYGNGENYCVIVQDREDPMDGWDFRSDLEIQVNGGVIKEIKGIGPLTTVGDNPSDKAFLMFYGAAVEKYCAENDSGAVDGWIRDTALPYFTEGWVNGSCSEFQSGGYSMYADVMWGECEMPWCITAY